MIGFLGGLAVHHCDGVCYPYAALSCTGSCSCDTARDYQNNTLNRCLQFSIEAQMCAMDCLVLPQVCQRLQCDTASHN